MADKAMMTEMAVPPAVDPNLKTSEGRRRVSFGSKTNRNEGRFPHIRVINSAASKRLEEMITSLGTAAKKAMLTSMSARERRRKSRKSGCEREKERESKATTRLQFEFGAVDDRQHSQIIETRSIAMGAARLTVLMGDRISDME